MQMRSSKNDILRYVVFVTLKRKGLFFSAGLATFISILFFTYLITPTWEGVSQNLLERNSKQQLGIFKDVNLPVNEGGGEGATALNLLPILIGKNMAYDIVREFSLDELAKQKRLNPKNFREKAKNFIVDVATSPLTLMQKLGILAGAEKNWVDEAVEDFMEDWVDVEVEEGTSVMYVTVYGENQSLAMNISNRMVELLRERTQSFLRHGATSSYEYVEKQLAGAEKNLSNAENRLLDFKKENDIVLMDEAKKAEFSKLDRFKSDLLSTLREQKEIGARLAENKAELARQQKRGALSSLIAKNPVATELETSLKNLEIKMASLLTEKSEDNPEVQRLKAEIQETKNALKSTVANITQDQTESFNPVYQDLLNREIDLRSQSVMLKARESNLINSIKNIDTETKDLLEKSVEMSRLQGTVDAERAVFQALKERLGELSVERESTNSEYGVRVLDKAYVSASADPDWPIWPLSVIAGAVLALVFGFGSIFLVEYWNDTIVYPRDIEESLSLPFLGGVPDLKSFLHHSNGSYATQDSKVSASSGKL